MISGISLAAQFWCFLFPVFDVSPFKNEFSGCVNNSTKKPYLAVYMDLGDLPKKHKKLILLTFLIKTLDCLVTLIISVT
jgi:hypothetical protein